MRYKVVTAYRKGREALASVETVRALGSALRELRQAAGFSGRTMADKLRWSQAKVSRVENGLVRPTVADVEAYLAEAQAPTAQRDQVIELANQAQTLAPTWKALAGDGLAQRQHELEDLLRVSARVLHFQPVIIPGVLQTPEYTRQLLDLLDWAKDRDVDAAVAARLARQRVLFEADAPAYHFLIAEAALRWRPGSWALLRAQLDRLRSLAELPTVTVQVIPWSAQATAYAPHGFVAYFLHDEREPPQIFVEMISSDIVESGRDLGALYAETFARLVGSALSPAESLMYISDVAGSFPPR
jgi:transcriptional regulator with XRE-family HTH domain